MTATPTRANLMLRNDTILGVCEAIGQDFGINPNWLRVAFCVPIYWNPMLVVGAYLALGLVVAATRLAFPDRVVEIHSNPALTHADTGTAVATAEEERELVAA